MHGSRDNHLGKKYGALTATIIAPNFEEGSV